jgi:integrase
MSIRRRTWKNAKGELQEAWIVDYVDQKGKRHIKTFERKKDADAYRATVTIEVRQGTHTADSASLTIAQAGEFWVKTAEAAGLERTTLVEYRRLLSKHIVPRIGRVKLSQLSAPMVREFEDRMRQEGTSPAMVRRVRGALSMLLGESQDRGFVNRNVARDLRRRRRGQDRKVERRHKGKLKVGIDIPTPDEIRAIVGSLKGRWRPMLLSAIFCGLRASELRGLRWQDVDFNARELHVRQRADCYNVIGPPKSEAGERTVPVPPPVLNALREWKLQCPKGALGLAFPNSKGNVQDYKNIIVCALRPSLIAAGVCTIAKDGEGKVILDKKGDPVRQPKYTGLHALRHFYASWCINRKVDGGLELPAKVVQERLGHSTIGMTMDTYGHLFPRGDDAAELETATARLFD